MKKVLLACVAVMFLSAAAVADAAPIVCGPGGCTVDSGIIDLGVWDPPQGEGGSASDQLALLNTSVIPAYNASNGEADDLLLATYGTDNINMGGVTTITLAIGDYSYIKLKWNGNWQYYYTNGVVGDVVFNSTVFNDNQQAQELSHYTFFSPRSVSVPDGGATMMLLGAALMGLAGLRMRK